MAGNGSDGGDRSDRVDRGKKQAAIEGGSGPKRRRRLQPEGAWEERPVGHSGIAEEAVNPVEELGQSIGDRGSQGSAARVVEGFFFRRLKGEDGKHIRRLFVKRPPGLGKTREAIDWAIRYRAEQEGKGLRELLVADQNEAGVPAQTSIFVPRHQLAQELREGIEGAFRDRGELITVPILRGRENGGEEGKALCRRWREARELARRGLPIYTKLCQRRADGEAFQCPYFAGCEYIQTRQAVWLGS
jgi:hypothetical protein